MAAGEPIYSAIPSAMAAHPVLTKALSCPGNLPAAKKKKIDDLFHLIFTTSCDNAPSVTYVILNIEIALNHLFLFFNQTDFKLYVLFMYFKICMCFVVLALLSRNLRFSEPQK